MTKHEQINHLKDFIGRWESAEKNFLDNGLEGVLIQEHKNFCHDNALPFICASELLGLLTIGEV